MNLIALEEPDAKWDRFISGYSNLLFHTSTWWKVLKQGYGYPTRYLVLEEEGEWLCVLPGVVVGNRFFRVFYSLIPYGGFIGDRRYIPEFLTLLRQWAKSEKIHRLQIVDPSIKESGELPDFKYVESFRHILDLKGKTAEQIWDGYEQSLQRNIKKAIKSDIVFKAAKSRQEVEQFYRLYLASMKRNKALAKYPPELFYGIFDILVPGHADLLFAKHQGQPIAGVVMVYSEDTAHYFHGGSATEHLDLRPNDLLFHRAIQLAQEKGKSYFDFFGSDKRFTSLVRFKDKWGTRREDLLSFHRDVGLFRPAVFRLGLKLAQTSFGSALHRAIKSTRKENGD